ncbi:MAG: T9SS type A sorting domain-containing protein [Bacteroidota bacterium]|nr:T9SS type A sorting domain-containing protein [Bacteroidota bacterium]MDP4229778.1 T9SS type A sorting domain-containing protein [Bacteroidota bacterium]MDP4237009.1 T9SS type A sorting domain-containing protein [Bacteroidota bacterium]
MRIIKLVTICLAVAMVLPGYLFCQLSWKNIGGFGPIAMIYFTDELHGFVSVGTAPGGPHQIVQLFRTTNGGETWQECTVDKLTSGYGIADMFMESNGQGWACGGCDAGYTLWHTTDDGLTWKTVGAADRRFAEAIKMTKAGIIVSDFYEQHVRLSVNGGASFFDIFAPRKPDDLLGMDFSDSVHGVLVASFRTDNPWYYTTDGGMKWDSSNISIPAWTVYGQKGTSNFFAVPEGYTNKPPVPSTCYRSSDFGRTWNPTCNFVSEMTGCITGAGTALYTQTVTPLGGNPGIYRSLDSGKTWTWLGGPNGSGETRFAAHTSSCHYNVIYAAGKDHFLYKAYDSISSVITPYSSSGLHAFEQVPARIHEQDTANVNVLLSFPKGSRAIGFIPDEIEYSLSFDQDVAYAPPEDGILPPDGWARTSVVYSGDSIRAAFRDTLGTPISATQSFGIISGFFALPPILHPSKNKSYVTVSGITLRNECEMVTASMDTNHQLLREIQVIVDEAGVSNASPVKRLFIFPNPAKEVVRIFSGADAEPQSVRVFDNLGRKVEVTVIRGSNDVECSVANLSPGTYWLVARYSDHTESAKFSIVR